MTRALVNKIMIGTKLVLLLILLLMVGSQFIQGRTNLDLRRALTLPPAPTLLPDELLDSNQDLSTEKLGPIAAEITTSPLPSQTQVGWLLIIVSSLLLLEGLDAKYLRTSLCAIRSAKNNQAGFTLVELLIVIGIIGIISGVVLVASGDAREKAHMATLYAFSGSVYRLLGIECAGQWEFNEGSGSTTADRCHGNDGVLTNNPTWTTAGTNHSTALDFDGTDDYVQVSNIPLYDPNKGFTFEAFVYSRTTTSGRSRHIISGNAGTAIYRNLPRISLRSGVSPLFAWLDQDGNQQFIQIFAGQFDANQWHHLLVTHDGTQARLYLNGRLLRSEDSTLSATNIPTAYYFGNDYTTATSPFDGLLDAIRIYNAPLPTP